MSHVPRACSSPPTISQSDISEDERSLSVSPIRSSPPSDGKFINASTRSIGGGGKKRLCSAVVEDASSAASAAFRHFNLRWWKRRKCHHEEDNSNEIGWCKALPGIKQADGENILEKADCCASPQNPEVSSLSLPHSTQSNLLTMIPHEVVGHCISFVSSSSDRMSIATTCRQFCSLSNADYILRCVDLAGEHDVDGPGSLASGRRCFLTPCDTRETAVSRLAKFVEAENPEAMHMLGMIKCYCFDDIEGGVNMLRRPAQKGHVQSAYALGIILRDCCKEESAAMLNIAARAGFLPALQEKCSAKVIKLSHGEPSAAELRRYLDPVGLGGLLLKHYVHASHIRGVATSHCWNPLCGKWAYKSVRSTPSSSVVGDDGSAASTAVASDQSALSSPDSSNSSAAAVSDGGSSQGNRDRRYLKVARMKMCSCCRRAKYCSKLCQVYDWRSGRHKMECQYL